MLDQKTKSKIKVAFKNVRNDIRTVEQDHSNLKTSTHEWIQYLERNQVFLEKRIQQLEAKLLQLRH